MQEPRWALRGLIYGNYVSGSAMAEGMGWPRRRLYNITNGSMEPDILEVKAMALALDKPLWEVAQNFLPAKSPNEQLSNIVQQKG